MTGRSGPRKLTQARNQLFGEVAKHPDLLVGVRPNGLEDTPQYKIDIDQKAQALGVSISDINTTRRPAVATLTTSSTVVA